MNEGRIIGEGMHSADLGPDLMNDLRSLAGQIEPDIPAA